MKIVKFPHPILRAKCKENFIIPKGLIEEMFVLMSESKGIGLAAPQVGYPFRLFVTAWGEVFINPVITERSGSLIRDLEGCLSLPGQQVYVKRHARIVLNHDQNFEGPMARVIQHEMDHLDGRLITDYLQ